MGKFPLSKLFTNFFQFSATILDKVLKQQFMKTLKIAAVLALAGFTTQAQDLKTSQLPAKVQGAFQKAYPQAKDVDWEMKGEYYKVEFDIGRFDHEISYDANGTAVRVEKEVAVTELPTSIAGAIKKKYPDYKIDSVEATQVNGKTSYKVEIEQGLFKERKLYFDGNGKLVSDLED